MIKIMWSDEANFKLPEITLTDTTICWDVTNTHITAETMLNQPGVPV
jgi:hypothetical protein